MITITTDKYDLIEQIGKGTYGIVYHGRKGNIHLAIKRNLVDKHNKGFTSIRELTAIAILGKHPNIVELHYLSQNPFTSILPASNEYADDKYFMVFNKEDDNGRKYFKNKRPIQEKKQFVIQSISALTYLHCRLFLHLDIKPENFLISHINGKISVKLCDLGMATEMNVSNYYTKGVTTFWYRAPEIMSDYPYDEKADFYSLGATILEIFSGKNFMEGGVDGDNLFKFFVKKYPITFTPSDLDFIKVENYNQVNDVGLVKYISMNTFDIQNFENTDGTYEEFINLLTMMIRINPVKRFDVLNIFNHMFMSSYQQRIVTQNNDINMSYPPVLEKLEVFTCEERNNIQIFKIIYDEREEASWYSHKILFTAIDNNDRFISRLYRSDKTPKTVEKYSINHTRLSDKEINILPTIIIYISIKYHNILTQIPNLYDLIPDDLDKNETIKICMSLEDKILDYLNYRIYYGTFLTCIHKENIEEFIPIILDKYISEGSKYDGKEHHIAIQEMLDSV